MSKRTALEIADQVDAYVIRTSIGAEAAAMLRQQHAEIERKQHAHHRAEVAAVGQDRGLGAVADAPGLGGGGLPGLGGGDKKK